MCGATSEIEPIEIAIVRGPISYVLCGRLFVDFLGGCCDRRYKQVSLVQVEVKFAPKVA